MPNDDIYDHDKEMGFVTGEVKSSDSIGAAGLIGLAIFCASVCFCFWIVFR